MASVLIIGASSDIGRAIAHAYAAGGYDLMLTARNTESIADDKRDIEIRYNVGVSVYPLDALAFEEHEAFYQSLSPSPQGVIYVAGYLGDNEKAQTDIEEARAIVDINYTGAVSLLNLAANAMESRKNGFIIGISSVAGDRGRKSNYHYGSAKAALSAYLSGLRNRLAKSGVHIMTVKPGFVDTKMTEGMDLPPLLTAQPNKVAADVFKSQQKKRDVVYTLWFWRYIMLIIRCIPERIFKAMSI